MSDGEAIQPPVMTERLETCNANSRSPKKTDGAALQPPIKPKATKLRSALKGRAPENASKHRDLRFNSLIMKVEPFGSSYGERHREADPDGYLRLIKTPSPADFSSITFPRRKVQTRIEANKSDQELWKIHCAVAQMKALILQSQAQFLSSLPLKEPVKYLKLGEKVPKYPKKSKETGEIQLDDFWEKGNNYDNIVWPRIEIHGDSYTFDQYENKEFIFLYMKMPDMLDQLYSVQLPKQVGATKYSHGRVRPTEPDVVHDHGYPRSLKTGTPTIKWREFQSKYTKFNRKGQMFIIDSGASSNVLPRARVEEGLADKIGDTLRQLSFETANSRVTCSQGIRAQVAPWDTTAEWICMENTPELISLGERCMVHGFTFIWVKHKFPCMISATGLYIIIFDIQGLLPVWGHQLETEGSELGTFEFLRNQFREKCGIYIGDDNTVRIDITLHAQAYPEGEYTLAGGRRVPTSGDPATVDDPPAKTEPQKPVNVVPFQKGGSSSSGSGGTGIDMTPGKIPKRPSANFRSKGIPPGGVAIQPPVKPEDEDLPAAGQSSPEGSTEPGVIKPIDNSNDLSKRARMR